MTGDCKSCQPLSWTTEAVRCSQDEWCTYTHHGGIKQLQLFERRREWRDVMRDKLTVGIEFHTVAYQIVVGSQTAPRRRLLSAQYWA